MNSRISALPRAWPSRFLSSISFAIMRILYHSQGHLSPQSAAAAASTSTPSCRTGGGTSRAPSHGSANRRLRTSAFLPHTTGRTRRAGSMMSATTMPRFTTIATMPRMMIARRRQDRSWTPGIHNDIVLYDYRFRGRFDACTVAMGTNRCAIRMGDDLRSIAGRAERTVNVTAVHPRPRRHTAGRKGERRSCQNRREVLVHSTPHFPFYREQGAADGKI